ncbi:unnamed protein product [Didymodactylos carnosus]|uniref:UBC core domain-containing protein n=1 Tax=Didymodactylos carnosus TaxID=1234261 RepID=A0A813WV02_9BILA|nr:unnamed protein product [Didymodactylos carnosus]CAF0866462.1 unnamed protein product [Didymodactylos carnosus]CAF3605072.1 unnamed protein product [Didymodactylos carnosus]CAF3653943.1 unnamed protein product [Didymodactylos carnosus]
MRSLASVKEEIRLLEQKYSTDNEQFQILTVKSFEHIISTYRNKKLNNSISIDCAIQEPLYKCFWFNNDNNNNNNTLSEDKETDEELARIFDYLNQDDDNRTVEQQIEIIINRLNDYFNNKTIKLSVDQEAKNEDSGNDEGSNRQEEEEDRSDGDEEEEIEDDNDEILIEEKDYKKEMIDGISVENHQLLEKLKYRRINELSQKNHQKISTASATATSSLQSTSIQATDRLMKELREIFRSESYKKGYYTVELVDDSLYDWNVKLYHVDKDSKLYTDLELLKNHEKNVNKLDHILLNLSFTDNYPFSPPFFFSLNCSMFLLVGHVYQGAICMEVLTKQGWSSAYSVESLVLQICTTIAKAQARIDFNSINESFSLNKALSTFQHISAIHEKSGWSTPPLTEG